MRIPHEDPNPPQELSVDYPKDHTLTWDDFHPKPKDGRQTNPLHGDLDYEFEGTFWRHIANEIHDHRTRFAQRIPFGGKHMCSSVDRSAALAVYAEALHKIEHTSKTDAKKIHEEVRRKVEIILDLRQAKPSDLVFTSQGVFLQPLEPHYADPRFSYYERDDGNDRYYWHALARLRAWRKEGWPDLYPVKAVEQENKERNQRGANAMVTPKEGLRRALDMDPVEWGDEVDANPERPWK